MSRWARTPIAACGLLLVVYVSLSFLNDGQGSLGTDTGGKVATLEVMSAHRTADPDVGYWAERWDPSGRLHPLFYTYHLGDRWVNVTTLPALEIAAPLYRLGGYRLALLAPMVGSILVALAARSLARVLSPTAGWPTFWLVGLAGPLLIYALDFWEHSLGVAAMVWGVRLLVPLAEGRWDWWRGSAAGALFGLAATMRTEAFVYGAVAVTIGAAMVVGDKRFRRAVVTGLGAAIAVSAVTLANLGLEQALLGQALRLGRTAATAGGAGSSGGSRLAEAGLTAIGLHASLQAGALLVGVVAVALVVLAGWASMLGRDRRLAVVASFGAVVLYASRAFAGLGFVPGLLAASPISGLAFPTNRATRIERFLMFCAVLPLPLVWLTQFQGGAEAQWGGRYILASGVLLVPIAVANRGRLTLPARLGAVGLAVTVTVFGLAWMSQRSHQVASAHRALLALHEPVLVSTVPHLAREGGAFYLDQRWLTASSAKDVELASDVVEAAGIDRFAVVSASGSRPIDLPGWFPGRPSQVRLFDDLILQVQEFRIAQR